MLENLRNFFKKMGKKEEGELLPSSSDAAKERLHLVLVQDRVNVSVDFLDMMKQEILEVIKRYIDVDEKEIDVRLTNQINEDGSNGLPALYANIPIVGIKAEKTIELNQNHSEKNSNIAINNEEIKISNNENNKNAQEETKNPEVNEKSSETAISTTETIKSSNTKTDEGLKVKKTKEKKVDKTDDVEETNIKKVASATTKKRTTTKKETISE